MHGMREEKAAGWMHSKSGEREPGGEVHSPSKRNGKSGMKRERRKGGGNARAEDGSFEGAGRWSSS